MKRSSDKVRPKKFLGQHFLHDQGIAKRIVEAVDASPGMRLLEIGPGTGVLTRHLVEMKDVQLKVVEIDRESVAWLKAHYPGLGSGLIEGDFLDMDLGALFDGNFAIIGNFPYNISSQIFFKVLEHRDKVDRVVCMLQKEVADRIAASHGNKTYGILSVLLQAFYDVRFLFKVPPGVFTPPPKVMSGVIRLERNARQQLACDEVLFVKVVRQGFNNRRKTLRNALKNLNLSTEVASLPLLDKRAEQLSVQEFISLTRLIEDGRAGTADRI